MNPTERIKINGKSISEDTFARLFFYVWDKLHEYPDRFEGLSVVPPYFRYIFLMAIQEFFEKKVDVAIIEVGLGGEKDPTNVLKKPVVCVITLIGYDHEHILGSTLAEIAWQKAGIFKRGSLALTIIQQPEAASSIEKRAADAGLKCYRVVKSEGVASDWTLGIKGDHQYQNAALAAEAARSWCEHFNESNLQRRVGITGDIVEEGLKYTHWQGRTEVLKSKLYPDITWYVDGAHNIDSIQVS